MSNFSLAVIESVEEAIYNSLLMAPHRRRAGWQYPAGAASR
ncbi:MAG: P1 family peptidase [Chloroflexi bacterium]|nr:P1 family peptidase [Chloroflexota bacterium]